MSTGCLPGKLAFAPCGVCQYTSYGLSLNSPMEEAITVAETAFGLPVGSKAESIICWVRALAAMKRSGIVGIIKALARRPLRTFGIIQYPAKTWVHVSLHLRGDRQRLIWKPISELAEIRFSELDSKYVYGSVLVQSLSHVWLFATPWTAACQASLSFTISQKSFTLMFMVSNAI